MKNKKILFGLMAILLMSCDAKPTSSTTSSNTTMTTNPSSASTSLLPSTSYDSSTRMDLLTFINTSLRNSHPTVVNANTTFTHNNPKVTLESTSLLRIEYGEEIKAEYTYTKEVLNNYSDDGEFITKETHTSYAKGKNYGILKGDKIVWGQTFEKSFNLHDYSISTECFEEDYYLYNDEKNVYFSGDVKNEMESNFFNGNSTTIKNIHIELKMDLNGNLSQTKATFKTENDAAVSLVCNYSYITVNVVIPE